MKYYESTSDGTPHATKKLIEWEGHKITDWGESQIDATGWRPDAEIARAAILSGNSPNTIGVYDFPDGIDTGFRPFRQQGADIVDIENAQRDIESSQAEATAKAEQARQAKQALREAIYGEQETEE